MSKVTQIRQKARDYLQKGKFDKAIEEYKRLTGMESKNPNFLNELGDIYLKAGDSVQAVSSFEKAVVNYQKVALYNNAVAVCKKILRIIPNRLETVYKLGELRAKQKLDGEARVYFSQYLDYLLADADSLGMEIKEKLCGITEFVQDCEEILSKVAMIFMSIGIRTSAFELLSKLAADAERTGQEQKCDGYHRKLAELKKSMTKDELASVEESIQSVGGGESPDMSSPPREEEVLPGAEPPPAAEQSHAEEPPPVVEQSHAEEPPPAAEQPHEEEVSRTAEDATDAAVEVTAHDTERGDAGAEGPREPDEEGEPVREYRMNETAAEIPPEFSESADEAEKADGQEAAPSEEFFPGDGEAVGQDTGEPETETPAGTRAAVQSEASRKPDGTSAREVAEKAEVPKDFKNLLQDNEKTGGAENLVEEITSDVEEDDYRSHYDLGLAYLEMALHTEAIKEFQIASRSEQLQIKSIEMIGYCFLQQNNPRLAVKQLRRGMELVKIASTDNLGIHYNLGLAYEMLGDLEKAREHFEEVYIVDISFRDIADKMKKLSTVS